MLSDYEVWEMGGKTVFLKKHIPLITILYGAR